jgi:hypothetical protein
MSTRSRRMVGGTYTPRRGAWGTVQPGKGRGKTAREGGREQRMHHGHTGTQDSLGGSSQSAPHTLTRCAWT